MAVKVEMVEIQHLIQLTLKAAEVREDVEVTIQVNPEVLEEELDMPWAVAEEDQQLNLQVEITQDTEMQGDLEESLQEEVEVPEVLAIDPEELEYNTIQHHLQHHLQMYTTAAEAAVAQTVQEEMAEEHKDQHLWVVAEVLTEMLEVLLQAQELKMDMQLLKNLKFQNQLECGELLKFINM